MKVIIAGSREITQPEVIARAVAASGFTITEVVSGGARGVDQLGEAWAQAHHIPLTRMPADWERYGKGAGCRRNAEMAAYADACLVCWNGVSRGADHMAKTARQQGLPTYVYLVG